MSTGENSNTLTRTILSFDTACEAGIAVDASGTPTNTAVYGVTLEATTVGQPGLIAAAGSCQIQAANATPVVGGLVELDANGRAVLKSAGVAVGQSDEAGAAAVGGKYKFISINLFGLK